MRPEAERIRELVEAHPRVLVVSHKDADGDTLGSALAMAEVLKLMGRVTQVRVPLPVPEMYRFLPGFGEVNQPGQPAPDLVMAMDASNLDRLAEVLDGIPETVVVVNIDHHVSNSLFGAVNLVVPEASSTAEVTYNLIGDWRIPITPSIATNLYVGLLTDTGGFRHENTTHDALAIAADLVGLGADPADIATRVYKSRRISTMKLQALSMATVAFECDDRLVHAYVSQEHFARAGASMEESEGLIDTLNSVDGLELALLFKEIAPGQTKISVRSRGAANANELAAVFNGGGHERAAGAEIAMPLQEAMTAVLAEARRMLSRSA